MQYTTHFNLNLPEGTDIVNPLVQDNPNYSAIDAAMFANKQAVIGTASEVVSGTVHAITRSNTDSDYFRFTATGNWTAGDSMSVDGTTVSVYLSDGTTPATGAYIINTEVLALLNGSRVTLIISSGAVGAAAVNYDNTGSGLTATNVQDAIDELDSVINPGSVSVIADGVKTYEELFEDLHALTDFTKITKDTALIFNGLIYHCVRFGVSSARFTWMECTTTSLDDRMVILQSNSNHYSATTTTSGTTFSNLSSVVPANGMAIELIY